MQESRKRFEQAVTPHREAAYNLARWLTHSDQDAQDVVQEALLRAFRFFESFVGENGKAWLLGIVRNTALTWMNKKGQTVAFEEASAPEADGPEQICLQRIQLEDMRRCLAALPQEYREPLVLREMEGLSYKEIANLLKLPIGTVMSRLNRGRERLKNALAKGDV